MSKFALSLAIFYFAHDRYSRAVRVIDQFRAKFLKETEDQAELNREIYALRAEVRRLVEDTERAERAARLRMSHPPPRVPNA